MKNSSLLPIEHLVDLNNNFLIAPGLDQIPVFARTQMEISCKISLPKFGFFPSAPANSMNQSRHHIFSQIAADDQYSIDK